jgi:hypothetical protein
MVSNIVATDQDIVEAALAVNNSPEDCCYSIRREQLEKLLRTRSDDRTAWGKIVYNLLMLHAEVADAFKFKDRVQFCE